MEEEPKESIPPPLTPRQGRALDFIRDFLRLHGYAPSEMELARHLNVTPPAAEQMVDRLVRGGHLTRRSGEPRSLRVANEESERGREAKAIALYAFRNGPIEEIHAGKTCPTCSGGQGYSRITDPEMRKIMKTAVNRIYTLMRLRDERPEVYQDLVRRAESSTAPWDPPEWTTGF